MANTSSIPLIARAESHGERRAIMAAEGTFTYRQLLDASGRAAACLLQGADDLGEARVAYLTPPGFQYAAIQWGIWRAGGVAVPLCTLHPQPELEYVIDDSGASIVVAHPTFEAMLRPVVEARPLRFISSPTLFDAGEAPLPQVNLQRRAMIL